MKKKTFLIITLIALMTSLTLPTKAYAIWPFDIFTKSSQTGNQPKFPTIIQKIIDKFKLNSGEVQKVMDEAQTERQQEMKARREARLEEAVKAGVITEEQKQTLLNKETEWQRKQEQLRQEMQDWRQNSGIDFQKLAPYGGFGGPGFGGRGFGKGHWGGF
jgi:hypothetical protein